MDYNPTKDHHQVRDYTIFGLLILGLILFVFISNDQANAKSLLFPLSHASKSSTNSKFYKVTMYRDELEEALARASTKDKTVIIAMVNTAYVEGDKSMLDIFLEGFWLGDNTRGLVDHLLIVAADQTSFDRCIFRRLHCCRLQLESEEGGADFVGEKLYMSDDFIKMMWRRTLFLLQVLKRGYHFIFTDTDVLWLRNPFPRLISNESVDLQISTDRFNGNQWSHTKQLINTGFYMIRSNNKTINLFDIWYARKESSKGLKEQDVLSMLMKKNTFTRLGLNVRFLDTVYFSGFCENSRDVKLVATVHANCCRSISAKVTDLTTVISDWKRFKDLPTNETSTFEWSQHMGCAKSWIT